MKAIDEITDHKEASEILKSEFSDLGLGVTIPTPTIETDPEGWKHYAFRLQILRNGKTATLPWRQGMGHAKRIAGKVIPTSPEPAEVVARYCAEYLEASTQTFEDWAGNFGWDTDSRKAEACYLDCQSHGKTLRQTLGLTPGQIERFAALSNLL